MLVPYRRHNPAKCKFTSRSEYRCKCPIWVTGTDKDGKFLREALNIRDWNRANELVRKWDVEGSRPTRVERVTIDDVLPQCLVTQIGCFGLLNKPLLPNLFRQIQDFARDKGIRNVSQPGPHHP
jgi:hypothetical protein